MYDQLEYLYKLFNNKKFILYRKKIDNNLFILEFCRNDNFIDKFSIIFKENLIETIVPLKNSNIAYKSKNYDLNNTINYLNLHLENYCN